MAQYVTKIRTEEGDKQIDYNALANKPTVESLGAALVDHKHNASEIEDLPTSLPANGGNASTLEGKHADDFALASDVEEIKTKLDNVSFDLSDVTITTNELNYVKGVTENIQTQLDGKSQKNHKHSTSDITSGTFSLDRLPTIPIKKGGTGATDAITALDNLGALGYKRALTANDDLNSLFEDGVFYYTTADCPSNAPFENASVILSYGPDSTTNRRVQIGIRYGEAGKFAFRCLYDGAWNDWASPMVYLHSDGYYGTSTPKAGNKGRIFFKKV